ncbi:hypothetical protein [Streptomyces sp. NPDC001135]
MTAGWRGPWAGRGGGPAGHHPFFVRIRAGARAEAEKPGVDLTVTDARSDASQQADPLRNFTSASTAPRTGRRR